MQKVARVRGFVAAIAIVRAPHIRAHADAQVGNGSSCPLTGRAAKWGRYCGTSRSCEAEDEVPGNRAKDLKAIDLEFKRTCLASIDLGISACVLGARFS